MVQGRRTSYLDDTPEETTLPHSRGSLLRDVVGVAVDADDPDTFALGPRDREKRSLQSQWIVVGGVIPPGDFDDLYAAGASAIFPPGSVIADSAVELIEKLATNLELELPAASA